MDMLLPLLESNSDHYNYVLEILQHMAEMKFCQLHAKPTCNKHAYVSKLLWWKIETTKVTKGRYYKILILELVKKCS